MKEICMKKNNKITSSFIKSVEQFVPRYDYNDLIWNFYLKINRSWHFLHVQRYQDTFYINGSYLKYGEIPLTGEASRPLEFAQLELLEQYVKELSTIYKQVKNDPISYHKKLLRSISPSLRKGVIPRKFVNILIPDYMRFDKELTKKETKDTIEILKCYSDNEPIKKLLLGFILNTARSPISQTLQLLIILLRKISQGSNFIKDGLMEEMVAFLILKKMMLRFLKSGIITVQHQVVILGKFIAGEIQRTLIFQFKDINTRTALKCT